MGREQACATDCAAIGELVGSDRKDGCMMIVVDLGPNLVVACQVYDRTGVIKVLIAKRKAGELGGDKYVLPGLAPRTRAMTGR